MKTCLYTIPFLCLCIGFSSCSILTKEDAEKDIRIFIAEFSESLQGPDSLLFEHFRTPQSRQSLLLAIRVMQNKAMPYIHCTPDFQNAIISFEEDGIKVQVLIKLDAALQQSKEQRISDMVFWLQRRDDKFFIQKFEGERFYNEHISLRNSIDFEVNQRPMLVERAIHYETAHELQKKYDSVVWFTQYQDKSYYYVVNGHWTNYFLNEKNGKPSEEYNMGLVDEKGNEIVPPAFDLIGTPGIAMEDVVEVSKNKKVGYVQLSKGQLLVPAQYEWIIPYSTSFEFALVKKDSLYGWLDHAYQFHEGFLNVESRQYVMNYEFLPKELTLDEAHQSLCEIPTAEHAAYGILLPPSYLTAFGFLKEIQHGFTVGDLGNRSYLVSRQTKSSFIEDVAEGISALMSTFTDRYLDGREEFYSYKQITFLNEKREALGTQKVGGPGAVSFKVIDSTLLEMKLVRRVDEVNGDFGDDDGEWNLPVFTYLRVGKSQSITELKSNRHFDFTEMVKIDSSYLSGDFIRYHQEMQHEERSNFLSIRTIEFMRNEILACYGYTFSDPAYSDAFKYAKWYHPQYSTYVEFMDTMTEIDRHNLIFLEGIVGTLDLSFSASL